MGFAAFKLIYFIKYRGVQVSVVQIVLLFHFIGNASKYHIVSILDIRLIIHARSSIREFGSWSNHGQNNISAYSPAIIIDR